MASDQEKEARVGAAKQRFFLSVLTLGVALALVPWFAASAAAGALQWQHGLSPEALTRLVSLVQIGFVVGTFMSAAAGLSDLVSARLLFGGSAWAAGACTLALLFVPPGPRALILLQTFQFGIGFFLAGVYPPAMKMAATWARDARGLAIGTIVAALTLGKAVPWLMGGVVAQEGPIGAGAGSWVLVGATGAAVLGGGVVLIAYKDGPYPFPTRPFRWRRALDVIAHRPTRLATYAYLGHMWEVYAMWALVPAFVAAHLALKGDLGSLSGALAHPGAAGYLAFGVIGIGAIGAVSAGWLADRIGRERVAGSAMAVSGTLAATLGWLLGAPSWLVVPLLLIWGITVVADSAQFSALVTEVAPADSVGTALTLQTSAGFLLTVVTLEAVPRIVAAVGWGWGFALLAPGPWLGILALRALQPLRALERPPAPHPPQTNEV